MASKKDLTAAVKNSTESIKGLDKQAKEVSKTMLTQPKGKKSNSDYLRLDLRPLNGKDYKAYIEEQARQESVKCGSTVSATKYIHLLIDKDMESQKGAKRTTKTDIIDMLEMLSDTDLKAVQGIVKALCK